MRAGDFVEGRFQTGSFFFFLIDRRIAFSLLVLVLVLTLPVAGVLGTSSFVCFPCRVLTHSGFFVFRRCRYGNNFVLRASATIFAGAHENGWWQREGWRFCVFNSVREFFFCVAACVRSSFIFRFIEINLFSFLLQIMTLCWMHWRNKGSRVDSLMAHPIVPRGWLTRDKEEVIPIGALCGPVALHPAGSSGNDVAVPLKWRL